MTRYLSLLLFAFTLLSTVPAWAQYRGDIALGDTIDCKFTTVGTDGLPSTLGDTPVLSAYVDNGTTEITSGVSVTADFDGRTGLNNARVVATGGNGFATGTNVDVVITTGTIGGNSVAGYVVCSFSIERARAKLANTTGHGGASAVLTLKSATIDAGSGGGTAVTINGGAASGATPAGHGVNIAGGASSTTGGGTAGDAIRATGGAASTATNVGGHGINAIGGAGSEEQLAGHGILATGGVAGGTNAGGTGGDGAKFIGGAATTANAAGHGLEATGGGAANNAAGIGGDALKVVGASASGAGAAGTALRATGGAATTTSGGTSAAAVIALGGAGASSTNGAAAGIQVDAGGTTTVSGNDAIRLIGSGNEDGVHAQGAGTGHGVHLVAGGTGNGLRVEGGGTSGAGINVTTTSGDGISSTPTAGNALTLTANGTSKHGLVATGGTAGTSDGIKAVAGTGGVDLRANQTGDITGNLSGSVGSVTGAVGSVTGNVGGNVVGSVASVTNRVTADVDRVDGAALDTHDAGSFPADVRTWIGSAPNSLISGRVDANAQVVGDKTGYSLSQSFPANFADLAITATTGEIKLGFPQGFEKNQAFNDYPIRAYDSTTGAPKTGASLSCQVSLDGGAFGATTNSPTELASGFYLLDLTAAELNSTKTILLCTASGAVIYPSTFFPVQR